MTAQSKKSPHVIILGAGLGGLALAQALREQGITYEVFEKDKGLHSRFQGWSIALHFINDDLLNSVPKDLPPLSTTSHLRPLDHIYTPGMSMYSPGEPVISIGSPGKVDFVRANRPRLRDWLSTHIDVQWDKHATRIDEDGESVTVHFSDGTKATGDVLVGADGVHSFVREQLLGSSDLLRSIKMGFVVGETTLNKEQYERQLQLGRSAYVLLNKKSGLRAFVGLNRIADDASSADYYWMLGWEDPAAANEPYWTVKASKQELYEHGLKLSESFGLEPKLTEIFRLTKPENMLTPPLVIRDMVLTELPNRRVTLLGDAAHPMTPFRGEGGNNAMKDSLNLARALTKSEPHTLLACLKEYQDEMLQRGSTAVKNSRAAAEDSDGSGTQAAWNTWSKTQGLKA